MANLATVLRVFGPSDVPEFKVDDELHDWEDRPDTGLYLPSVDYDGLLAHYDLDRSTTFRERVANLKNPEAVDQAGLPFHLNWVTSIDVTAANKGRYIINPFFQLAAIGMTRTSDNQIVMGIRGGAITLERREQFASGLLGAVPGGSLTFEPSYETDPVTDVVGKEFAEELGHFKVRPRGLVGIFGADRPGPTGIKFVSALDTDATLSELQNLNGQYNSELQSRILAGEDPKAVRKDLGKRFPHDLWEHTSLIGVANSPYAIRNFVGSMPQAFSGIGAGALLTYAAYLEKNPSA